MFFSIQNSQTALIMAAKGGYSEVVRALLERYPNVNAVDKDGYTALTWAAKEGYGDIAYSVVQRDAYVNLPDRVGINFRLNMYVTIKGLKFYRRVAYFNRSSV